MTAEEKADYLIERYEKVLVVPPTYGTPEKCALVMVEEILDHSCFVAKDCQEKEGFEPECTEEFWKEVKEILTSKN